MIIRPFDLKDPWPGPVISGLSVKDISFGKPVADPRMDDVVSLLSSLRARHENLLSSISEIHVDSFGGASLILSDSGISIRLRDDDWEWKLSCIQPVLDAEQASGRMPQVAYVDFCGQKAFVGYKSPSPGAGQVS
jgi:hypothetical protein